MSNNLSANVRPQYGPESLAAAGTPVAADRQFVIAQQIAPHPQLKAKKKAVGGSFRNRSIIPEEEWMNFDMPFDPDYREIGWLFSSCFGQPVSTIVGNDTNGYATGSYHHVWRPSSLQANAMQTFTLQYGVAGLVFQCSRALFNKLQLKTKRSSGTGNISGDAAGFARRREVTSPANTFSPGPNEVQTIDISGAHGATLHLFDDNGFGNAGTHDVVLGVGTTAPSIQTMYDDIFGAGNTAVSGSAGGPFTVTYQGTLANKNMPLIGYALIAGTSPTLTLTETQRGGVKMYDFTPVLPNEISIWYSPNLSDLFVPGGSALMLNEFSTDLTWDKLSDPVFRQNRAESSYGTHAELGVAKGRTETIDITVAVDSQGTQFWDDWRAAAQKYWGLQALSQHLVAGSTYFELRVQGSVSIASVKDYADNDGIWSITHQLEWTDNPANGGKAFEISLVTDVASYAVA